jgi:hypothetical protein
MGRSSLGVDRNALVSLHFPSVIRSTAARLEAAQGWKSAWFQRWWHWYSPLVVTSGSGFLVAEKSQAEVTGGHQTPRPRCRRSLREPYNLRMHATVGVGLAADRKRRRSPTARDTARSADNA